MHPEAVRWEARATGGYVSVCEALAVLPSVLWAVEAVLLRASLYTPRGPSRSSIVGRRRRRRPGLGALAAGVPAMAASVERLQQRIQELERELAQERSRLSLVGSDGGGGRARIEKMSPEVVDSNPYR